MCKKLNGMSCKSEITYNSYGNKSIEDICSLNPSLFTILQSLLVFR